MTNQPTNPAAAAIELARRIAWVNSLPDEPQDPLENLESGWAYAWPGEDEEEEEEMTEIESGWADDFGDDEQGGV